MLDLTSLVVAITAAPVVVAPSMNPRMWKHPPIARNVAQLREDGIWVIEPGVGGAAADRSDRGVGGAMIAGEGLFRARRGPHAARARAVNGESGSARSQVGSTSVLAASKPSATPARPY